MKELGKFTLIIVEFIYAALAGGFVFLKFYSWFILSTFKVLPTITYPQSIGLVIFITCMLKPMASKPKDKDEFEYHLEIVLIPWLVLGLGYLVFLGTNL